MSTYDFYVTYARNALQALEAILTRANTEGDVSKLLQARLVPDMLPLAFQVWYTTDLINKLGPRVLGTEPVQMPPTDELTSFEACQKIFATAKASLDAIDKEQFEARIDAPIEFGLGPKNTGKSTAKGYLKCFSQPNICFHLVTAYNILRKEGVQVGKMDYAAPFNVGGEVQMVSNDA